MAVNLSEIGILMMTGQTITLAHPECVVKSAGLFSVSWMSSHMEESEECYSGPCPRNLQERNAGVFLQLHRG